MLRLKPPRQGKSPNWTIRGAYLGIGVDETTGTAVEALAQQILRARKREIERDRTARGDRARSALAPAAERSFDEAALAYIQAGGDARYLGRYEPALKAWTGGVIPHLAGTALSAITQQSIDELAVKMYPQASAMTRNRHVYTPVSAVLKHAGIDFRIRRPKGWRGKQRIDWLQPEEAFAMLDAAGAVDAEFRTLLAFLLYTGCRLNEGLGLTCDKLLVAESFAYVGTTKNGDPRGVHLPPFLVAELANHPRGLERANQRLFRFRKCGRLYTLLRQVKTKAGVQRCDFHIFCHTWATWMRRYGGLDTRGLVGTGRWRDQKSAARYEHVVASEESRRADLLPTPAKAKKAAKAAVQKVPSPKLKSVDLAWNGRPKRLNR